MTDLTSTSSVVLRPWPDALGPGSGVALHTAYVDRYWMPLLGPLATCLARLLTRIIQQQREPVRVSACELTAGLGLPETTPWDVIDGALGALTAARIVSLTPAGDVHVRAELPHLDAEQEARLPLGLRVAHQTSFALRAEARPGAAAPILPREARLLSLASTVEEVVSDPDLRPRQLAYRFQHVVRLAEEARDEALLDWAAPDLVSTLAECQLAAQAAGEAIWAAQHDVARRGELTDARRVALRDAAAALVDWMVAEFPPDGGTWVLDDHDL